MQYQYLPWSEMNSFCQTSFNICSNSSDLPDLSNPVGCWQAWAKDCAKLLTPPGLSAGKQVLVALLIIIAVLSFIGNTVVCIVFFLYDQLRLVKHYFVINLAVVDNILAVVSIPMFVAFLLGNSADKLLCRAQIFLDVLCGTASIISLAVISVERYIAVVLPLHYDSKVTVTRAVSTIIFTWFYSVMVSLITLLAFAVPNSPASTIQCLYFGGEFVIFITITSFVFPVAIMAVAYWNIFLVAHAHAMQIQAMVPSTLQPGGEQNDSQRSHGKMKGELKAAKTLTIIMGTHILCWCPLFIYFLVISFCKDCAGSSSQVANYIILVLRYCNTLANPIIYTGINRQFRAAIKKFVLMKFGNDEGLSVTAYSQAV